MLSTIKRFARRAYYFSRDRYQRLDWGSGDIYLHIRDESDRQRLASCAKEPETVQWLEKEVKQGTVVFDIGANVGAYSLVAASLGATVVSVEPSFSSFSTLSKNILRNKLEENILPLQLLVSEKNSVYSLSFSSVESGAAQHIVSTALRKGHQSIKVPGMTLDTLCSDLQLPTPELIKIDVDGGEWGVFAGGSNLFRMPQIRSILVEIDFSVKESNKIVGFLSDCGFRLVSKHAREKGKSTHLFNCIFSR